MTFSYQAQKFSVARSNLMIPHPNGEAESIAHAFHECSHGLHKLNRDKLDDHIKERIEKLDQLMDCSGLKDPSGVGLYKVRAERLTVEDKIDLSNIINELADWFDKE